MTDTNQQSELEAPFPRQMIKKHPTKGLSYVPVSEVIAKLNRVLGSSNWSYEVNRFWEAGTQETQSGVFPKWVMAHVTLTAVVDGERATKDGVGGQEVKTLKPKSGSSTPGGVVDLGDEYKGAMSDALKKAAQGFGVGLELAREDDAIALEREEKEADEPKANQATLDRITELVEKLDDTKRPSFNKWWAKNVGKKVASGLVTIKEADKALQYLGDEKSAE
jgi:hypothetical protein